MIPHVRLLVVWCGAAAVLYAAAAAVGEAHNPITTTVRFEREVAAILNAKCAACHRDGGMAMALQTYEQVRPWAVAIKEEILARHMPPWPAERGYGSFANDTSLTPREQDFLISWIEGGAPRGEGDPPPYIDHTSHWMLGAPDHTLTLDRRQAVPAGPFRRFVVETRLDADAWVRAIDFRPGDAHTRAAFFTLEATGQFLGGWTRGAQAAAMPEGVALRLPRRARIVVETLSGEDGAPPADAALALYVATGRPAPVSDIVLRSAPGRAGPRIEAQRRLPRRTTVYAMRAAVSEGGRSVEVRAVRPDGSIEPLLFVREFSQAWQTPYVLRAPVTLPAGSLIQAIARFADTAASPAVVVHIQSSARQPARSAL